MLQKFSWKNLKLGHKYGLALTVTLVVFMMSSFIVWSLLSDVTKNVDALEIRGDRAIGITELGSLIRTKDIRVADYITFGEKNIIAEFEQRSETFNRLQENIKSQMDTSEQIQLLNRIIENDKKINELFAEKLVPSVQSSQPLLAATYRNNIGEIRAETIDLLEELRTNINADRRQAISAVNSSVADTVSLLIVSVIVSVGLGVLIIILVNRLVKKAFNTIIDTANEVAEGNLAVEHIQYSYNDELGKLSTSINIMVKKLTKTINRLKDTSESLTDHSLKLNQASSEVSEGGQQIAATMQELSSGAESQATQASESAILISHFMDKVQAETKNSESLSASSKEVLSLTEDGSVMMHQSREQMVTVYKLIQDAVEKVGNLDEQSRGISKLVHVIQNMAKQTNLLALNATIEAARAGEHGKGFAVVAEEVRKLAEQVSDSVYEITGIVEGVQTESNEVSLSLQGGYEALEKGTEQLKQTGVTFETIKSNVNNMVLSIGNMTENLNDISANGDELNRAIESVASVSEESSAGVEQTSASVQQTSSTMQEISSSSDELAQLSVNLNEIINQFALEKEERK